jgi:hypothetical protein
MLLQQQEGRGARRGGDHPAVLWSWKGMLLQQQAGRERRPRDGREATTEDGRVTGRKICYNLAVTLLHCIIAPPKILSINPDPS